MFFSWNPNLNVSFFLDIILESYLARRIQQPILKQRIVKYQEFVNIPDTYVIFVLEIIRNGQKIREICWIRGAR